MWHWARDCGIHLSKNLKNLLKKHLKSEKKTTDNSFFVKVAQVFASVLVKSSQN